MTYELRFNTTELEARSTDTGKAQITGYASVFNTYSRDLGGFVEQVLPGAFRKTIQEADVRALVNHDKNMILGRTKAGTLALAEDSTGLHYVIDVPDTTYARDLLASIERRDITGSSFGFKVVGPHGEDWSFTQAGYPLRSLAEVALFDVSPVTTPAYEDTTTALGARSLAKLCELRGVDPAVFADVDVPEAVQLLLEGRDIESDAPAEAEPEPDLPAEPAPVATTRSIEVKRARLALMAEPTWRKRAS